ncbi:maleylpyruvate isomerase family mycothiol-dependent enzyme [Aeromicrobium sp. Marseille-Q0843]|uniref:Maleylpyruvate isomerase family mycothiol-dependent enzyme n=1 Tax=Aeromicrobium phoceense TaxID=2754045 RepID=A0A838XI32_9ACTN|nr:maleylpyruvate isomerase family mycothiol-dependent enzyme [Aeromicrobium phoceense]MBA4608418.1 maleylpyruvate isomerase family mycothiol-dependent enzyme [Aeromicrobium phoceense]
MTDVWPIVHAERDALIADLEQLPAAAWDTPSLCAAWTVHVVVAHLVDTALTTRVGFVAGLARARFDFDRQNDRGVRRHRGATPAETLRGLRSVAKRTTTPPAPLDSRLVEAIVHGEDIRRPLAIARAYPQEAVERAIHLQSRTPRSFGGGKELLTHVRLSATDSDVALGDGPEVSGPALSLLLVLTGRAVALEDLEGPGLEPLTAELR